MCDIWTAEEWQQNAQPVMADSRYSFDTARYSTNGQVARVYSEIDGWFWAVRPGKGNDTSFKPKNHMGYGYDDPRAAALEYLAERGFTLTDDPTQPQAIESTPPTEPEEIVFIIEPVTV